MTRTDRIARLLILSGSLGLAVVDGYAQTDRVRGALLDAAIALEVAEDPDKVVRLTDKLAEARRVLEELGGTLRGYDYTYDVDWRRVVDDMCDEARTAVKAIDRA